MQELPAIGTKLGRYVLEDLLGEGGVATVFLARHELLGSLHALKLLHLPAPSIRRRLLLEGRIQATVKHPHIVRATDTVSWGTQVGVVLELIDGPTLTRHVDGRPQNLEVLDRLAAGLFAGTGALHRAGYIHRDLKPDNVLMDHGPEGWVPRIADCGLARAMRRTGRRTRDGVCMGTAAYMAPEQIRDAARVDERADIWSLGCILYELATGRAPFDGDGDFAVMTAVTDAPHTPVHDLRPDLRPGAAEAIEAALQKDPEARPTSIHALSRMWRRRRTTKQIARRGTAGTHLSLLVRPRRNANPSHLHALVRAHP